MKLERGELPGLDPRFFFSLTMSWLYHWPLLRGAALSLMPRGVWVFGFWSFSLLVFSGILILFDFILI